MWMSGNSDAVSVYTQTLHTAVKQACMLISARTNYCQVVVGCVVLSWRLE